MKVKDTDMQKKAWIYAIAITVLGAFGGLLRWLQCEMIFDEITGLPQKDAGISTVLTVYLILTVGALWWLSGYVTARCGEGDPEGALNIFSRVINILLIAASVVAGLGGAYMFLVEHSTMLRVAALLGILSATLPALYPALPRWGGFGAFLSLLPVAFFSLWLVTFYKSHAVNPVVWEYGMEILAISVTLFAAYRVSGCLFYRLNLRHTVFACGLGTVGCLTVLMDRASADARILLLGWGVAFGVLSWVLLRNAVPREDA